VCHGVGQGPRVWGTHRTWPVSTCQLTCSR
jgi:hypothetical protein